MRGTVFCGPGDVRFEKRSTTVILSMARGCDRAAGGFASSYLEEAWRNTCSGGTRLVAGAEALDCAVVRHTQARTAGRGSECAVRHPDAEDMAEIETANIKIEGARYPEDILRRLG